MTDEQAEVLARAAEAGVFNEAFQAWGRAASASPEEEAATRAFERIARDLLGAEDVQVDSLYTSLNAGTPVRRVLDAALDYQFRGGR